MPTPRTLRFAGLIAAAVAAGALLVSPGCRRGSDAGAAGASGASAPVTAPASLGSVPEEHHSPPIAVVNGVTVYQATSEEILDALRAKIQPGDPAAVERYLEAARDAVEKAIDEELLFQEATRLGYGPKDDEVARVYTQRAGRYKSEDDFLKKMEGSLLSKSEVIYDIRRALALDRWVKAEVEQKLTTTEEEARAFYDARPELFTPNAWLHVGEVFARGRRDGDAKVRADALSRISMALQELRGGHSFESVARERSDDPSAANGGIVGYFKQGDLPEKLDRVVFALADGQLSDVVEGDAGYYIFKVFDRKGGRLEPFEKVKDQAREQLRRKNRAERLSELVADLRSKATIEYLKKPEQRTAEPSEPFGQ